MPVIRSTTISTTFGAGHVIKDHSLCGRAHGHQYTVSWTWTGEPDAKTGLSVAEDKIASTMTLVREFAGRSINDMMPMSPPTVGGMAGYLLERMQMHGVTRVEVYESDTNLTGEAHRLPG